ncbi:MAG TPA: hypothetical protein VHJ18_16810 [Streptosporangiaceae bacterium]|nr:hypothetical protein [Streptosporangiaceae bacterium]
MIVAGGVGAGVMTAGVAVIHAAGVTGVVVAIAGPGGIALLGIGAVYLTYRLLTRCASPAVSRHAERGSSSLRACTNTENSSSGGERVI